jgi:hypothetical protein
MGTSHTRKRPGSIHNADFVGVWNKRINYGVMVASKGLQRKAYEARQCVWGQSPWTQLPSGAMHSKLRE